MNIAAEPCIYEVCRLKRHEHSYYKPEMRRMERGRIIHVRPPTIVQSYGYRLGLSHLPRMEQFSEMDPGSSLRPYVYGKGEWRLRHVKTPRPKRPEGLT